MHLLWFCVLTLFIAQLSAVCTTIYLHRSVTHRGLELHPAVAFLMHLELLLFTGMIPRQWAAVHRKHHHFTDVEGDPHSPMLLGLSHVLLGNYFFYRKYARDAETVRKYTPDYKPDLIDKLHLGGWGGFLGMGLLMLLVGPVWGAAVWLTHAVLYVALSGMVNGLGHAVGYRTYDNGATNLKWLAWVAAGEGLHNNHHQYPTAARFSMRPREFDPAWPLIRLMERLGLARVRPEPLAKAA